MKTLITLTTICFVAYTSFSQNEDEILRLSSNYFGGNARNISLAGTMASFGWEFSAVQTNPAAIGRTRKSTLSITGLGEILNMQSNFYGAENSDLSAIGKFGAVSFVKAYKLSESRFNNWKYIQLGAGYERVSSFEARNFYEGDAESSILQEFSQSSAGLTEDQLFNERKFDAGLAYDVFALSPGSSANTYIPGFDNGNVKHKRTTDQSGGIGNIDFMMSANYADKLYLGGTFKVSTVVFTENFTHQENYVDSTNFLNAINYTGELETTGLGYSTRIGAVYLPIDAIRLGLSVQTPTIFRLTDSWTNNMTSSTDDGDKFVKEEFVPQGESTYRIKTPMRLNATLGYIHKNRGGIGVVLEYVDHANGQLMNPLIGDVNENYDDANIRAESIFRSIVNFQVGVEARITPETYTRVGFAHYPSAYKEGKGNEQFGTQFYTAGFGFNSGSFYMDLGYSLQSSQKVQFSYNSEIPGSKVQYNYFNSRVALTIGFRID